MLFKLVGESIPLVRCGGWWMAISWSYGFTKSILDVFRWWAKELPRSMFVCIRLSCTEGWSSWSRISMLWWPAVTVLLFRMLSCLWSVGYSLKPLFSTLLIFLAFSFWLFSRWCSRLVSKLELKTVPLSWTFDGSTNCLFIFFADKSRGETP